MPLPDLKDRHEDEERAAIRKALADCGGVIRQAAAALGVQPSTLTSMMARLAIVNEPQTKEPANERRIKPPPR